MAYELKAKLSLVDKMSGPMRQVTQAVQQTKMATEASTSAFSKMARAGSGVSSAMKGLAKSSTGMGSLARGVTGLAAAYMGAHQAASLFQKAAGLEQSQVTVGALFKGDTEKANKFFDSLQTRAAETMYSLKDYQLSASALIPVSGRDLGMLDKMTKLSERLGAAVPEQGLGGASFAMRELFSGDTTSIVERFNLPRQELNKIKSLPLAKQLEGLDKILNGLGYTSELVSAQGKTAMGQWAQATGTLDQKLTNMVKGSLERLKPILEKVNAAISSGAYDKYFTKGSDAIVKLTDKAIAFGTWVDEIKPKVSAVFTDISKDIEKVTGKFGGVGGAAKTAVDYVLNNWPMIKPVVYGVTAGIVALTAAQWALNVAMTANPVGIVIAALAGLGAAAYAIYTHWEEVRAKTIEVYDSFGTFGKVALFLTGPIGQIIVGGIELMKNWDAISSAASSLWTSVKSAFSSGVDYVIAKLNKMIDIINSLGGNITRISTTDDVFKAPMLAKDAQPTRLTNPLMSNGWTPNGSHYNGISSIPYDGYLAELHRGERVQTKAEVDKQRNGSGSGKGGVTITGNTFNVRQESDIERIADALAEAIMMKRSAVSFG